MELHLPKTARIIIIEGITGSGKDTVQGLLKGKLRNKVVYDYSEGEMLFSWKHVQIPGISKMRLELMNGFVDYMAKKILEEPDAVFVLNRFHVSAYMAHVSKDRSLGKNYGTIVKKLQKLPVHILFLKPPAHEVEKRASHSERAEAWKRYQKMMMEKEGFTNRKDMYLSQQKLMMNALKRDGLPFSVVET